MGQTGGYARRILVVLSIALLATAFAFTAIAGAQTNEYPPPTSTPGSLIVTPPHVPPGGQVSVSGDSCGANMPVTVTFNGAVVATTTTDANGHFSASFTVPAGTAPGSYTVTAANGVCNLAANVQVDAAGATKLAFTGSSDSIPTLWVGLGLVVLGAGLVFVARRRISGTAR